MSNKGDNTAVRFVRIFEVDSIDAHCKAGPQLDYVRNRAELHLGTWASMAVRRSDDSMVKALDRLRGKA